MSPMVFEVLTIFPDIIRAYTSESIMKRAVDNGIIDVRAYNIRDFTTDRHRQVDDYPFGGGTGMILKPEPIFNAVEHLRMDNRERATILLSPGGRIFNQSMAEELARKRKDILMISGRYEGVDERIRTIVDEEVSAGDYILTGGELPALIIIDAVTRLLPGALGNQGAAGEESFAWGLLEYPQYTRPSDFSGLRVPDVLLSGNHRLIRRWRRKEALRRTLMRRPDMLAGTALDDEDYKLIREIKEEGQ